MCSASNASALQIENSGTAFERVTLSIEGLPLEKLGGHISFLPKKANIFGRYGFEAVAILPFVTPLERL